MALIVLDASVLIAHLDSSDAIHVSATEALLAHAADDLRLPISAYAELLVGPVRRGRLEETRDRIAGLGLVLIPIAADHAERAAQLRAAHRSLVLPDALILACADLLDASVVLTADRRWRRFPRVRVLA